jgi:hypothetical protein
MGASVWESFKLDAESNKDKDKIDLLKQNITQKKYHVEVVQKLVLVEY